MRGVSKGAGWTLWALMSLPNAHAADQPPAIDEDFLEYLGTVDDGEEWTLFEDQETKLPTDARKPVNPSPKEDAKSVSKQTASKQK
jgi:hypothetical protein